MDDVWYLKKNKYIYKKGKPIKRKPLFWGDGDKKKKENAVYNYFFLFKT